MGYSKELLDKIFAKGDTVRGMDPERYRKDARGTLIYRHSYGKNSEMGWQVDHITPKSKGGDDSLSNLRPLHHRNNRRKSDGRLKRS